MTTEALSALIRSGEADHVEVTRSTKDVDKFREAICSFSNDMAGRGVPGHLVIGFDEKDPAFRLQITDDLLQQFASYRSDGQVLPLPVMNVVKQPHPAGSELVDDRRAVGFAAIGGDALVPEIINQDEDDVGLLSRSVGHTS